MISDNDVLKPIPRRFEIQYNVVKNRNLVQAKLSDHDFFEVTRYCKKNDLNINRFIKLSVKHLLYSS